MTSGNTKLLYVLLGFLLLAVQNSKALTTYQITTTWNNQTIDHPPIQIGLDRLNASFFQLTVNGPFFNDPICPPGPSNEPFYGLWNYEVAEVFFLNDANQYVEIEVGPFGHYIVLLLNGYRETIRHSLFIDVITNRTNTTWEGRAVIPADYLPPNVTKMNAYAIHGSGDNRTYESLYPVPFNSAPGPDFHKLEAFQPFNRSIILTEDVSKFSTVWTDSLDGIRSLTIESTWNGSLLPVADNVQLQISNRNNQSLILKIEAPFYNDPAPPTRAGPLENVTDYEVIHLFLLNEDGKYLQVSFGPYGHYAVFLMPYCEEGLDPSKYPLTVNTTRQPGKWTATVTVPIAYIPPKVTKSNAGSAHGTGANRTYNSLYPIPRDAGISEPDYTLTQYYKAQDFEIIFPTNVDAHFSPVWDEVVEQGTCSAAHKLNVAHPFTITILSALLFVKMRYLD